MMSIVRRELLQGMAFAAVLAVLPAQAASPPAPGVSPRVDQIRERGALRVAVLPEPPWLKQNTAGAGEPFEGPAWLLATAFADGLGVPIEPVPVSRRR